MNALKSTLPIHAPFTFHIMIRASNGYRNCKKKRKHAPMGMDTSKALLTGKTLRTFVAACLVVSVSACSWNEQRSETLGGVVGGIVGGIIGSKAGKGTGKSVAIILGATLGAMWGQDIAKGMSNVDKVFHERTTTDTLEYAKPDEQVSWSNPDSGNSGTVAAGETYQNDAGEDCRQFETTVQVEGEDRATEGTACRMPDGTWQVLEEPA